MKFYLGTHEAHWLGLYDVPLFVSRARLIKRKSFPRAVAGWGRDSQGFTMLSQNGLWTFDAKQHVAETRLHMREIGNMDFASPQDWMCEPPILAKTGLTVADHQAKTIRNFLELRSLAPEVPWIPVLQGWLPDDYLRCADAYEAVGVDLGGAPLVGVGTVCRRQNTAEAIQVLEACRSRATRLHGFGFKKLGLIRAASGLLASADSMSWSIRARKGQIKLDECSHLRCNNCPRYAMKWRQEILDVIGAAQAAGGAT